ncbi:MAG: DUF3108 domain-containing protein [Myxococcota bacterium]|nr:DUF3108 domain-containing protein [Myxococcota bacterium]
MTGLTHGRARGRASAQRAAGRLGACFLVALCLGAAAPAEAPEVLPLLSAPGARDLRVEELLEEPPRFRFPPGERVVFEVRYLGIPVGFVTKEVARIVSFRGRRIAHLVGTARTNAFFSALFRIDDRSEAFVDIDSFRTLQTATRTRHGRRREVYEEVAFDWETHFVHVLEDKRWKRTREYSLDFGPDVYDAFDVVYAVRSMPLEPGTESAVPVYASFKIYGLEVPVEAREPIETGPLGIVTAVRLAPRNTLDGESQGDGRGQVWLAADGRRVPLRVVGWMRPYTGFRIGAIRAELVEYAAGDPSWEALAPQPVPPRAGVARTERGRPVWRAPREILLARGHLGIDSTDTRHPDQRIEELVACGELPVLRRYFVRPGEPGRSGGCTPVEETRPQGAKTASSDTRSGLRDAP